MSPATSEELIFYTDRSAVEADDTCGMKYWWNRKAHVRGIVPKEEPVAFAIGRETHNDLEMVARMEDLREEAIKEIVQDLLKNLTDQDKIFQERMELLYRRLGWFVAFALFLEPNIRKYWDDIGIEKELILDRTPLWVGVTPDRVLQNKADGRIVYKEYKTTISASQKWMQSWYYAIQLHIGMAAIQEELKQKVSHAYIMGLMKGGEGRDGRMIHPYVWAWYNHKSDAWSCSYQSGDNWTLMPVWEYPHGIVSWVKFCGEEVAKNQFPHSSPVMLNERMLEQWVSRRVHRERVIRNIGNLCKESETLRNLHFEMRTKNCRPPFGTHCPYLQACWNAETNKDPLGSGLYVPREPHHEIEKVLLDHRGVTHDTDA